MELKHAEGVTLQPDQSLDLLAVGSIMVVKSPDQEVDIEGLCHFVGEGSHLKVRVECVNGQLGELLL